MPQFFLVKFNNHLEQDDTNHCHACMRIRTGNLAPQPGTACMAMLYTISNISRSTSLQLYIACSFSPSSMDCLSSNLLMEGGKSDQILECTKNKTMLSPAIAYKMKTFPSVQLGNEIPQRNIIASIQN